MRMCPAGLAATALAVVLLVPAERAGGREFAELVTDHRLGDEHRDVLAAVVHGDGVTEHVRYQHRSPGPGLDDVLGPLLVLYVHLLLQVVVDEGTLLQATWHRNGLLSALLAGTAAADNHLVARLVRTTGTAFGLAPRADGVPSTGGLTLTTTVRVIDRVHRDTTHRRALALPAHPAG